MENAVPLMKRIAFLFVALVLAACGGHQGSGGAAQTVSIGSTAGSPGSDVTVPITLTKSAANVVTIAPLVFEFDPAALSFDRCVARVSGKAINALSPSSGRVSFVLAGNLAVIPEGPIADCTFHVNANAARGVSALRFVRAGMADLQLHDIAATGANGAVTVR
jgi:hypothetical protein